MLRNAAAEEGSVGGGEGGESERVEKEIVIKLKVKNNVIIIWCFVSR
jgi:hypothetical protein